MSPLGTVSCVRFSRMFLHSLWLVPLALPVAKIAFVELEQSLSPNPFTVDAACNEVSLWKVRVRRFSVQNSDFFG